MAMRLRDIMTKGVVTATPDMPLKAAVELLVRNGISSLPVVDQSGDLVGIVTEGDLVILEIDPQPHASILVREPRSVPATVGEVMTRDVVTLPDGADVSEAARLMLERHLRHIPLLAEGHLVGIVSRRDVLRVLARDDADIQRELTEFFEEETLVLGLLRVEVKAGVVTIHGAVDRPERRLAELVARNTPGVVDVRFSEDARPALHAPGR
jgi:CBS domain-containing protein